MYLVIEKYGNHFESAVGPFKTQEEAMDHIDKLKMYQKDKPHFMFYTYHYHYVGVNPLGYQIK